MLCFDFEPGCQLEDAANAAHLPDQHHGPQRPDLGQRRNPDQGLGEDGRVRRDPQLGPIPRARAMQDLAPLLPAREHHGRSDVTIRNQVQLALPPRERHPGRFLRRVALPVRPLLGRGSSGDLDPRGLEHGTAATPETGPGHSPEVAAHLLRHRSESGQDSEKRRVPGLAIAATAAAATGRHRFFGQRIFQAAAVVRRILPVQQPEAAERCRRNSVGSRLLEMFVFYWREIFEAQNLFP